MGSKNRAAVVIVVVKGAGCFRNAVSVTRGLRPSGRTPRAGGGGPRLVPGGRGEAAGVRQEVGTGTRAHCGGLAQSRQHQGFSPGTHEGPSHRGAGPPCTSRHAKATPAARAAAQSRQPVTAAGWARSFSQGGRDGEEPIRAGSGTWSQKSGRRVSGKRGQAGRGARGARHARCSPPREGPLCHQEKRRCVCPTATWGLAGRPPSEPPVSREEVCGV